MLLLSAYCQLQNRASLCPTHLSVLFIGLLKLIICIHFIFFSAMQYLEQCLCMKKTYHIVPYCPMEIPSTSSEYLLSHFNNSFILYSWIFDSSCSMGVAGITLIPEEKEVLKDCQCQKSGSSKSNPLWQWVLQDSLPMSVTSEIFSVSNSYGPSNVAFN